MAEKIRKWIRNHRRILTRFKAYVSLAIQYGRQTNKARLMKLYGSIESYIQDIQILSTETYRS